MKNKIYCFDLDNVLCKSFRGNYLKSRPIKKNIKILKILKKNGYYVKIFTARYMGRNGENIRLAKKQGYDFTKKQLKKWGVFYDELIFGKPSYDYFIDDKNLSFNKNWPQKILKQIKKNN